jgi:hypothetical protein
MTGKCQIEVLKDNETKYIAVAETATDAYNKFMTNFYKKRKYQLRLSENDQVIFHTDRMPLHEAVIVLSVYLTSKYAIAPLLTGLNGLRAKV